MGKRKNDEWKKEAVELAKTKRFKGKPLSLATHLNKPWTQVVEVLSRAKLIDREEYVLTGNIGFPNYDC